MMIGRVTLWLYVREVREIRPWAVPPGIGHIGIRMHESLTDLPETVPGLPRYREQFRERFAVGHTVIIGYDAALPVHAAWVARNKIRVDEIQGELVFQEKSCCVYNVETIPAYRGRGIFPAVLSHAADWWMGQGGERVYIYAESTNGASIRGIEHAGWKRAGAMSCFRLPAGVVAGRRMDIPETL